MPQEKKRIGLVLSSIHTGVSLNVWGSFVRTAAIKNTSLFIFPGGRLNARTNFENLRNPVYYLVNEKNLDGCIAWSSAIRFTQSNEEFNHFHQSFDPLPCVTLGYKAPGHPCVEFDAYSGIKALVRHCIEVHGAKKIAFIRGPDFHQSAQARFEGYYDALKEAGLIPVNGEGIAGFSSPLVSDPCNWSAGEAAAAQLFEGRSLKPGRDFDTLIGASDLMTLGALTYFAGKGFHVPRDYRAAGFNNSEESRITESPLSTVHLPYAELSGESFKILLRMMGEKKRTTHEDVFLNTGLVIRESCGCVDLYGSGKKIFPVTRHEEDPALALAQMAGEYLALDAAGVNGLALPVIQSLLGEEAERSFPLFEKALIRFFNSGRETENLLKLIGDAGASGLVPAELSVRLEPALCRMVFRIREQMTAHARYEKEQWNTALNTLKCDLLGTRDRYSLIRSLARHLPKIGVNTASIVLYRDDKSSVCVGSFSSEGISSQAGQHFPAGLLVPLSLKEQYADGIFMVQPLFIENQSLGYFVHNAPLYDGVIFEELRSAVSYALKGIFLLEETMRAKQIAEQAERVKTEFLRTLENGFREAETGHLADWTLSHIDGLSLHKTIFDVAELLPGIGTFPLLSGDTEQLAQCFSLIREEFRAPGNDETSSGLISPNADYSAALSYGGLVITFCGAAGKNNVEDNTGVHRFSLLLAEKIVNKHGGEMRVEQDRCSVTLPWTSLTGQEVVKRPLSPQDYILVLSSAPLPADFFSIPRITNVEQAVPDRTALIVWNAAGAGSEDMVRVASLRHKSGLAGVPFLCYAGEADLGRRNFGAESSIISALKKVLKSPKKGVVLFIGFSALWNAEQLFSTDEIRLEKIHIDSMSAFNETVGEISPSLVVFNTLDPSGAAVVRQHPLTVMVPIVMISDRIESAADVMTLSQYSRLIICHRTVASSAEFTKRLKGLAGGDEILPPHTGILVKKAILYFSQHTESHISRWKLADTINVSEDYLTRIFHHEMGLSLWDYLNRYRIFRAAELLRKTDDTIADIAYHTGFQDQTYFCRVFKKIYGVPPGQLRKG
ncbi:hypothetical protein AGMMS50293_07170 [Spirochaetia bacterium]|nr:hypothetical protein AGMMS50293_07170 [Spirochaetia bacterium]